MYDKYTILNEEAITMNTRSIRYKLFALLMIMGALPLLFVITVGGMQRMEDLEQTAMTDNWLRNAIVDEHLTEFFEKNFCGLHALTNTPVLRQYAASQDKSLEPEVLRILTKTNAIFQDDNLMAITGADGQQLLRTDGAPLVNLTKRKHFQEAMQGRDYISDVIVSMSTGKLITVLVVPILDEEGRPIGMLQRNFSVSSLQTFVRKYADYRTNIFISDRTNGIIAHSSHIILSETDHPHANQYKAITRSMMGVYGVTHLRLEGEDHLVSFSRNQMTGWAIATTLPLHYIREQAADEIAKTALLGFIVLLFVSFSAYLLSDRATRPILKLAQAAMNISKGTWHTISVSSDDELKDMAEAFNNIRAVQAAYQKELERDVLTKLYNKTAIEAFFQRKIREFESAKERFGLIAFYVIDLDHFKEVNDVHGHQYGDRVLIEFSKQLKKIFRPTDCVGRFGGDEFVIIIDRLPSMEIILEKAALINEMARELDIDGKNAGITASIGIAIVPRNGADYETVFKTADDALYHVKNNGRDHYHYEL